jgi:hypothetical protein
MYIYSKLPKCPKCPPHKAAYSFDGLLSDWNNTLELG